MLSGYRRAVTTATYRVTSLDPLDDVAPVPGRRARRSLPARVAVLAPAALMLVVGLVGLDRGSMWRDEAASLVAARRDLADLWAMLAHVESVHAVYYTFLHGWLQLDPGGGVVWARVPSVLAMTLVTGLVGVLGARLASVRVGVLAGLLLVVNPSVSFYAQEARSTALVAATALLTTWLLLQAVERRPRWWLAYGAGCVLLVGLNLLAVLVPLAHAATLLWWRRPRRDLLLWVVAAAPAGVLVAALAVLTGPQQLLIGWIPRPGLGSVKELAHLLLGDDLPVVVAGLLLLLGALPTAHPTARRALRTLLWPARDRLQAVAVPLLVIPPVALIVASLVQPVFVPRYVFPSAAGAALLGAVGIERLGHLLATRAGVLGSRGAAVALPVVLVVLLAVGNLGGQRSERTPESRPDDLAGAAAVVAAGAQPGDGLLFVPDNRRLVAQVYPDAFSSVNDLALAETPEQTRNLTGRPFPVGRVLANIGSSSRVWVVGRPDLHLMPTETSSRAELDLLRRDFVAVDTPQAHGVGITLFVRRPGT